MTISYNQSTLYYTKAGTGKTPLLLFHGFGQSHTAFNSWIQSLEKEYTLYAFDLYFHGKSTWPEEVPLTKANWQAILTQFFTQENIESFAVAGFSLGGKFALAAIELFPDRVKKILLIAPDGIKTNFWYSLATYPTVLRHLFKSTILKPDRFHGIVKILRKLNIVDKGVLRFAESQMDTKEKRERVYHAWVTFRLLIFHLDQLAAIINHHNIPVTVLLGQYDKVIPMDNIKAFLQKLNNQKLEIAQAGHNDLITRAADLL